MLKVKEKYLHIIDLQASNIATFLINPFYKEAFQIFIDLIYQSFKLWVLISVMEQIMNQKIYLLYGKAWEPKDIIKIII